MYYLELCVWARESFYYYLLRFTSFYFSLSFLFSRAERSNLFYAFPSVVVSATLSTFSIFRLSVIQCLILDFVTSRTMLFYMNRNEFSVLFSVVRRSK